MKRLLLITLGIILSLNIIANGSLNIANVQRDVSVLKNSIYRLQQENNKVLDLYQQQKASLDSLYDIHNMQSEKLNALEKKLGADLTQANKKIDDSKSSLSESINSRTWVFFCGFLIALALLGLVYLILRKKILRGSSSIVKIKAAQESLAEAQKAMQEESIKLDNKLVELLDKQVTAQPQNNGNNQPDHSFALKVGDEIARIETNLLKMDKEVRGYKQLKQALKRIKDNFNAHGYEIIDLLGQDYNEGMPFEAQFVPDDNLPEGKRVISGIIRLQINYNGEMIQSAKIVVRQNI